MGEQKKTAWFSDGSWIGLLGNQKEQKPAELTTGEITTRAEFRDFLSIFAEIFSDPRDREPDSALKKLFDNPNLARFFKINDGKRTIGFELIRINPNVNGAMYVPYAGLIGRYRNAGIHPKAQAMSDEHMRSLGADHALYDLEDERVIDENIYPDESPDDVRKRVQGRQNYWRRQGVIIVNDTEVPYCRPASDNPKNIQAYDSLAFRLLDENDPKWKCMFNDDKSAIRMSAYVQFYLEIMQIEFGTEKGVPTKDELRREYPAIDKFFKQVEAHPGKEWVSIVTGPVRPKATPDTPLPVSRRAPKGDQRRHKPRN